jgi:two-component system cell cycle sensor histidine kinase/response regulator CckA
MTSRREPSLTVEHQPSVGSAVQLTVAEGRERGTRFKVTDSATIGRSPDATIMLDDPEVSRLHARLSRTEAGLFQLEDLGSRNGTFVNGDRVESCGLSFGDKIRVGPHTVLDFQRFDAMEEIIIQRQRVEAVGRLGVVIAHDLNNVLAALDAGAAYLRELPSDRSLGDPEVGECLSDLTLTVARAGELTRAILSFARGRGTDRGRVELAGLVGEVLKMLRHVLDPSIRIESTVEPEVAVHGSKSELYQVLLNLCLNARDAMPRGGTLRISAAQMPLAPSELDWPPGRSAAVLSVSDTGTGMDAETQARVFDLFFTTKRDGAGYGLGLNTVRELITLHGGQISLESMPGRGTRFTIYLPLLGGEDLASTVERQVPASMRPIGGAFSILLVDDEQLVRRSVARRFRQAGFVVTEASSGAEAVVRYSRHAHDLVLLDLDMPGIDGEETNARLRAIDPRVSVVFVTGFADPQRAAKLRASGAYGLIEKPVSLDTLVVLANEVLEAKQDSIPPTAPV